MRFSKENMKSHIVKELIRLEKKWGFDSQDGYNQVKDSDLYRVMAYGEYEALNNLWDSIEYNNIGEE
jgi:hypothetical protein